MESFGETLMRLVFAIRLQLYDMLWPPKVLNVKSVAGKRLITYRCCCGVWQDIGRFGSKFALPSNDLWRPADAPGAIRSAIIKNRSGTIDITDHAKQLAGPDRSFGQGKAIEASAAGATSTKYHAVPASSIECIVALTETDLSAEALFVEAEFWHAPGYSDWLRL